MTAMDSRRSNFPVFSAMTGLLTYRIIVCVTGLLFSMAEVNADENKKDFMIFDEENHTAWVIWWEK